MILRAAARTNVRRIFGSGDEDRGRLQPAQPLQAGLEILPAKRQVRFRGASLEFTALDVPAIVVSSVTNARR